MCACRPWRAATKVFCWRSAIRRSAATAARIRSPARSAWATCRWRSSRRNSASPSTSATSRVTECQMVNQFKGSKTVPPQFTRGYGLVFGLSRAQGDGDGAGRSRDARRGTGRGRHRAGAERRVRAVPLRQHRGDRLRRAPEAAALRRFPERAAECAAAATRGRPERNARRPRNDATDVRSPPQPSEGQGVLQ